MSSLSAKVFHMPFINLTPGLKLHSVVQRSPKPGSSAPDDLPSLKHFTSWQEMLKDPDVDLVVVTTPPDSHFELSSRILESGKHVLAEKPFVPTAAEAEKLLALSRDKGKLICVYQNRRWDADFLTVKKLLDEDKLGRVYEFESHLDRYKLRNSKAWQSKLTHEDGFGPIYDLGTHLLDQVYALFGLPTTVFAKFIQQRGGRFVTGEGAPEDQPDSFNAMLTYEDRGLIVHGRSSVLSTESQQLRFWVRGSKGSYRKTGWDTQEPQLLAGAKVTDEGFGVDSAAFHGRLELLQEDGSVKASDHPNVEPQTYLKFYELLAKALQTGKESDVPVPASQAADVLRIVEAALESAKTGKCVSLA